MRAVTACVSAGIFAVSMAVMRGSGPPDDIAGLLAGPKKLLHPKQVDTPRFNIVILGDGFTSAQMQEYHDAAKEYADDLLETAPFKTMKDAIAIYRLNVVSLDQGIDVPKTCDGVDSNRRSTTAGHNNALKVKWCGNSGMLKELMFPRSTVAGETLMWQLALESGVFPNLTIVLLNDWMFGALAMPDGELQEELTDASGAKSGGFAYVSIEKNLTLDTDLSGALQTPFDPPLMGFPTYATHETAHLGPFYLADEYAKPGRGTLPKYEQHRVENSLNLSLTDSPPRWSYLLPSGPPASNCPVETRPPSPPSPTQIDAGAVPGGLGYEGGVYHARCRCRMHSDTKPSFCIVCRRTILDRLSGYLPDDAGLSIVLDSIRVKGPADDYMLEYKIEGGTLASSFTGTWPTTGGGWRYLRHEETEERHDLLKRVAPPAPGPSGTPAPLKLSYKLKRKAADGPVTVATQPPLALKFSNTTGATIQAIDGTDHRLTLALIARR